MESQFWLGSNEPIVRRTREIFCKSGTDAFWGGQGLWFPTHAPGRRRMDGARKGFSKLGIPCQGLGFPTHAPGRRRMDGARKGFQSWGFPARVWGFPPMRQEEGAWMGHGVSYELYLLLRRVWFFVTMNGFRKNASARALGVWTRGGKPDPATREGWSCGRELRCGGAGQTSPGMAQFLRRAAGVPSDRDSSLG
jgi:hypothetical protein